MKHSKKLTSAASLTSLFTAATSVDAAIQYFDETNAFTVNGSTGDTGWDVDGDSIDESLFDYNGGAIDFESLDDNFRVVIGAIGTSMIALSYGFSLDGGANFFHSLLSIVGTSGPDLAIGFTNGEAGYMGFRFNPEGTTLYGWAEIILSGGSSGNFEVLRWAYEDSGAAIQVGAIPEPASTGVGLGVLALGAAGLRRWRGARSSAPMR